MKQIIHAAFGGGLLIAVLGCGSSDAPPRTMTLQGSLSASDRQTDNARAVAFSDTGHMYWSYLSATGGFTLKVPVNHAYRVVFANQLPDGGQVKIGHVTVARADSRSTWLGANGGGTVNLGRLSTAGPSTGLATLSSGSGRGGRGGGDGEDDDNDHSGDYGCHHEDSSSTPDSDYGGGGGGGRGGSGRGGSDGYGENDDNDGADEAEYDKNYDHQREKCDVYEAKGEDVELKPSHEPGNRVKDAKEPQHQQKQASGGYGDQKPCTGSKCGGYGSAPSSPDQPSAPKAPSAPAPSGGGYGSTPAGSSCNTSASCTSTCTCVASKCQSGY
jgi:hypothetical protein